MPNASTFDEVKGTDKRGQFKRKTIFSFYCRVKVPSIKVRISERKAKFIWTFPNGSTFSVAKGTDTLGDWLCPKGVPVPVFSSQILNPHCGLVPLIPGLTRDLLRKWFFFMFFSLFRQREVTKRDHVARSDVEEISTLSTVLRDSLRSNKSSHHLKVPCLVVVFLGYISRYRNIKAPSNTPKGEGDKKGVHYCYQLYL